jgi:cytochrome c peroxidase
MHSGQFATLEEVLDHYLRAPASPDGRSELKPLKISDRDQGNRVNLTS